MNITVQGALDEDLRAFAATLEGEGLRLLLQAMGVEVQMVTAEHLRQIAATRHATSSRLGATPSNHYAFAADKVASASALSVAGRAATLSINAAGMSRAFRDVTIVPKSAKALALPMIAEAYNRRPAQFPRNMFFVWRSKTTGNAFLALRQDDKHAKPVLYYFLCRHVKQPQDRTLLPSDATWQAAARRGAENQIRMALQEEGLSA